MIPSIEINHFASEDMFCIFCGERVLSEDSVTPCSHVLFIATSEAGYEHESDLVADLLPLEEFDLARLKEATGFPAGSFIIEIISPAPSMMEVYAGFSPPTG